MDEERKTELLHEVCSAFQHCKSHSPPLKLLLERIQRNEGKHASALVYSSTTAPTKVSTKWMEKLPELITADPDAIQALILKKKILKRNNRLNAKLRENIIKKMTVKKFILKVNKIVLGSCVTI